MPQLEGGGGSNEDVIPMPMRCQSQTLSQAGQQMLMWEKGGAGTRLSKQRDGRAGAHGAPVSHHQYLLGARSGMRSLQTFNSPS